MTNKLVSNMKNCRYIISLIYAKQLLEPIRSFVFYLQGNFEFKKIEEIIHIYIETHEKVDELFQSVFFEGVSLANEFGIEQKWLRSYEQQINWDKIPATVKKYWQRPL